MNLKRHFLPIGLSSAIVLALAYPEPGAIVKSWEMMRQTVMLIFLVNGLQSTMVIKDVSFSFVKAFLMLVVSSLLLSPFLGKWLALGMGLPQGLAVGLMVMSAMPTTLSSGIVIAEVAGGSASWALLFTMGLNLVGIFSIPFVLAFTLNAKDLQLSSWPLFLNLVEMVLLPFIAGLWLKKWIKPSGSYKMLLSYTPSVCIILVVWASLSASANHVLSMSGGLLFWALLSALLVHGILLGLHYGLAKVSAFNLPETKSFVILGSQKTLPIALSVLTALHMNQVGPAILICLMFHFSQLLLDSWLASRWSKVESLASE